MDNNAHRLFRSLETGAFYKNNARPLIIADDLRTPENMGAVLRLAGNIGALSTIFLSRGGKQYRRDKIRRTASGAAEKVDWQVIREAVQLDVLIPEGYQIVALETSREGNSLFGQGLPGKVAFLVGNEVTGISGELLARAHYTLYIPLPGTITSLNVTHALATGLFEWYRQMVDRG